MCTHPLKNIFAKLTTHMSYTSSSAPFSAIETDCCFCCLEGADVVGDFYLSWMWGQQIWTGGVSAVAEEEVALIWEAPALGTLTSLL